MRDYGIPVDLPDNLCRTSATGMLCLRAPNLSRCRRPRISGSRGNDAGAWTATAPRPCVRPDKWMSGVRPMYRLKGDPQNGR